MDHFAVETWLQIFTLACTDGGYTGRSLSLACQRMRAIVQPVHLQTVSLIDEEKLYAFVRALEVWSPPVTIRHLLIFTNPRVEEGEDTEEELDNKGAKEVEVNYSKEQHTTAELQQSIDKVLAAAAPNVKTLVIQEPRYSLFSAKLVFPALRDLTINEADFDFSPNPSHFPSLRRMHISSYFAGHTGDFWLELAHFAPGLTHLRLSGVTHSTDVPSFLQVLLHISSDNPLAVSPDPEASAIAEKLLALRHVVVQPLDYQNKGLCGTGRVMHRRMMKELRSVAEASGRGKGVGKLRLMPKGRYYGFEDAWKDWLDVIEGGAGPWAAGEENDTSIA
ncbi:hypothetical protein PsYK624_158940 [Phanerochaete sordida]|uniref:Uncharacterized protein n=1 Tax=Phanerochaete sordida TaxID=48140 RepID=A0A9P3GRA9_9APHY|nr:hypothetical protein PsYK624_158940 [Phanerochaete sordida]